MTNEYDLIERIEKRISELPKGYISKKNNRSKPQYYLQWKENGKTKSKYISADDVDTIRKQIEERKQLQKKLKELKIKYPKNEVNVSYETNVVTGDDLRHLSAPVKQLQKRDLYERLKNYLKSNDHTRVCAVFGLRRTGKTTMLLQAISEMSDDDFAKSAYIKFKVTDTMAAINRDLNQLWKSGYRYIFMDEVTLMEDFIDSAALFSDIFVAMGMKIVLSGTDSLGFWFAERNELYDRVRMIHTTFIPYREHSRLLNINSIDSYIQYGGTLRMGEIDFDDEDATAEDASFRDDETARKYIDTAISKNIQHSLACYDNGGHFRHLYALYEADELTGAINRIIEDMNHRFVLSVLEKDFKSNDLGISARNLRKERDTEKRTAILDEIDTKAVTERLMSILNIKNKENRTVGIENAHILEIKEYLKALDLIINTPIEYGDTQLPPQEHILFTQPGMRYCQAQALVHSLLKDDIFNRLTDNEKEFVCQRILEEVRGRMLEDIVLLESSKALGKDYKVFKLQFSYGEFDMVIRNNKTDTCAIYEIKHSSEIVPEQARHLRNSEMIAAVTPKYGKLVGKYVLYLGEDCDTDDGILYRNAESYLKVLPNIDLCPKALYEN